MVQRLTIAENVRQPGQDYISLLPCQAGHAFLQILLAAYGLPRKEICQCPQHLPPFLAQPNFLSWTSCNSMTID